jgi:hypothetical protein
MFGLFPFWREWALQLLTVAYGACGVAVIASYAPQFWRVWSSPNGARDLSLTTWTLWCLANAVTVLYAALVTRDWAFVGVSGGSLVGCLVVTGAVYYRRCKHGMWPPGTVRVLHRFFGTRSVRN